MDELKKTIREVPDWPKEGILFYDITTLLKDADAFKKAIDAMCKPYEGRKIDAMLGVESRGFIFASVMAERLGTGFIPVRKPGKLPSSVISETYALEYGEDTIEMHEDAVQPGQKILIVDDLLATGGTAQAACNLVKKAGGEVAGCCFMVELTFLNGREKLADYELFSLLLYDT